MRQIDPALCRSALTGAAWLAALIGLSGCLMIPYPNHQVYEGTEIMQDSLPWLRAGETTRTQVLEKLGAPDIDFVDRNTIAYAWSGQYGGFLWVVFPSPGGGFIEPIRMRRALMIRFDDDGKVAAFSIMGRPTEIISYEFKAVSLDAKYDDWSVLLAQWLEKHGRDPSEAATPK